MGVLSLLPSPVEPLVMCPFSAAAIFGISFSIFASAPQKENKSRLLQEM